jgi:tRNA nucleotidyltransferase (CCA-adding enzyme)
VLARLYPLLHCDAWLITKAAELRSAVQRAASAAPALTPDALPRLYLALLTYQLPQTAIEEFLEKFRIRKEYRALILEVHGLNDALRVLGAGQLRPSEIVAALDESSDEARLVLRIVSDDWLVRQRLDLYQRRLQHVRSILTGDDLRRMGLQPGRIYRRVLERLRAARLDGELATRTEEEALVRQLLTTRGAYEPPS